MDIFNQAVMNLHYSSEKKYISWARYLVIFLPLALERNIFEICIGKQRFCVLLALYLLYASFCTCLPIYKIILVKSPSAK